MKNLPASLPRPFTCSSWTCCWPLRKLCATGPCSCPVSIWGTHCQSPQAHTQAHGRCGATFGKACHGFSQPLGWGSAQASTAASRHPQPHPAIPGSRGFADHLSPVSRQLYCVQPPTPLGPPSATLQLCASHSANQPPSASHSVFLSQFPRGRAWVLLTLLPDLDRRAGAIYQPPLPWWPRPARTQGSAAEVLLPQKTCTELKVSDHWLQYASFSSVIFFPELSIFMRFQICGNATKTVVQRIPANSLPRSHKRAQA